jgi:putative transposase
MPYKQTSTQCVVRLVALRGLSPATLAQCQALRAEAGRLWTDLVVLYTQARDHGQWLSASELEQATKGGQYALHSQSVQALCQKFAANVETATALRKRELAEIGHIQTAYPHRPTAYQTVVWKDQALTILPDGQLRLPTGGQRSPVLLPLPAEDHQANLRRAELTWRADHYELCLTLDTGAALPSPKVDGEIAGVDLGEVHIAAVTTTQRHALVVSGRQLRACKQWRNKVHAVLQEKLSRCQLGSRRAKRLQQRKAQLSAKLYRQQRNLLHQAARKVVTFCEQEGVSRIAVGDVRDIQTGASLGTKVNQKISQWPHGQFARYLTEKAARLGMSVEWIDEAYSTRTCSVCSHVHPSSPRGRRYACSGCGARGHRDANGASNICSKAAQGRYGQVQADTVKYLRPIGVAPLTRANVASSR